MPSLSDAFVGNVLPARLSPSLLLKSGLVFLAVVVVCVLSVGRSACAQEIEPDDVVKMRTDIVTVPVVVVDSRGHRVVGLRQDDFVVRAEGQPQRIEFFVPGASRVALLFLLDASGSARSYLADQREAALSLVSQFGPKSEVAVVHFTDVTTVRAQFSKDIQAASKGFDFPAHSGRHTAIFDSAMKALQMLRQRGNDPTERRIVVITSDGLDTASKVKAADVIARARNENVSFYVIHFPLFSPHEGRLKPRPTSGGFRQLAEKTGGDYFVTEDAAGALAGHSQIDLSAIFKAIAEDLAGQYLLGFYPVAAFRDGRPHKVEVGLAQKARNGHTKALRDEFRLAN
jgi:VWFA-related protein